MILNNEKIQKQNVIEMTTISQNKCVISRFVDRQGATPFVRAVFYCEFVIRKSLFSC